MSDPLVPNIGAAMIQVHDAITRSLQVTKAKCLDFSQPSGAPDQSTHEGFLLYASTMGAVINAHHISEDDIIFPRLRISLPQAPFDELSAEHRVIDTMLSNLRQMVSSPPGDFFDSLSGIVTGMYQLWMPHIAKEKRHIYSPQITAAFMSPAEHINMMQDTSAHALEQGDPALMVPFLLYNLKPEERRIFAGYLPPEMIQTLIPNEWKPRWEPMTPFLLE